MQELLTTIARYGAYYTPGATGNAATKAQQLIGPASRAIINELNRLSLISQVYSERYDGPGWDNQRLMLRQWPVSSLISMSIGRVQIPIAAPISPTNYWSKGAVLEPWQGLRPPGRPQSVDVYGYCLDEGRQNVSVSYQAGYLVQGEALTVPTGGGNYTPLQPYGIWSADNGVTYAATGAALTAIASGVPGTGQYVPPEPWSATPTTNYAFAPGDQNVALLASYSYVPADLEQAAIAWIAERQEYANRVGMRSQSLGGQETFAYDLGAMPAYVAEMLQPYRMEIPLA